jgi:hypothetical protein
MRTQHDGLSSTGKTVIPYCHHFERIINLPQLCEVAAGLSYRKSSNAFDVGQFRTDFHGASAFIWCGAW